MPIEGLKEFNAEIGQFAKTLLPRQFVLFHQKIGLELLRGVVLDTPVDKGRARGNWQVTIDVSTDEELDVEDKTGSSTQAEGQRKMLAEVNRIGQVIYITNNVPYVEYLENGTAKMAPVGMLRSNIERLRTQFRA